MATTVTTGTLKVSIIEDITLSRVRRGSQIITEDTTVGEVSRRIVEVTHASGGTILMKFASGAEGAGIYDYTGFKYLRVTNLDSSTGMIIVVKDDGGNHYSSFLIPAKRSFILSSLERDNVADIDNYVTGGSAALIDNITAKAATGTTAIKAEYIVINT